MPRRWLLLLLVAASAGAWLSHAGTVGAFGAQFSTALHFASSERRCV